jgi:hypothetical protein
LHRKRRWVFAALGVAGLGAAGVIGWLALQSGNIADGGATSPEGVAQGIVDALNHEDLAAASTFVSARELPDLGALVTALQAAAKAQGISGLSQGDGADLTIDLKDATASELATGVSKVDLTLNVSIKGTPPGPIGTLIGDGGTLQPRPGADIHIIVVKESGKWFASPLLTIGDYVADASDLPGPDYAALADQDQGLTASSPTEAFDLLAQAIGDRDVRNAGAVLGEGEARFVRVFDRAIEDLVSRADANVDVVVDRVEAVHKDDDLWALRRFDVTVTNNNTAETSSATVRDGCLEQDGRDPECVFDSVQLTKRLDSDQILVHVSTHDGRSRIELATTAIDYATQFVSRLGRQTVLQSLGLEVFDTPVALKGDESSAISFTGERFKVVEFDAAANDEYLVRTSSDNIDSIDYVDYYRQTDKGQFSYETGGNAGTDRVLSDIDEPSKIRAVVFVDPDSCDPGLECTYPDVSLDVSASRLQVVPANPGTIVSPNVGPGKSIILRIDASSSKRYEVSTDTPDVTIRSLYFGQLDSLTPDGDGYYRPSNDGPLDFLVTNNGGAAQLAAVAITEQDPVPVEPEQPTTPLRGFSDGSFFTTVDLSSGFTQVTLYVQPNDQFTISASPDSGQDVVLDLVNCTGCRQDSYGGGVTESTNVSTYAGTSSVLITIESSDSSSAYGTVSVFVEFTG